MRGREAAGWIGSSQAGVEAVGRFQGGANGQILFVGYDGQSIPHQAVGHTSISIFSDSAVENRN